MTPRTLWTILIKIAGISLLLTSLTLIPQAVSSALQTARMFSEEFATGTLIAIVMVLASLGFCFGIMWLCLFKTDQIINRLSLDKHFTEEKFEINIHHSTIIKIAIIITGGLVFIDSVPRLCKEVFTFYQETSVFRESPTMGWIVYHLVELTIGYLLITKSRQLTNWIELNSGSE